MQNYDVNYFIKKFEIIPEDKWISFVLRKGDMCCAQGHCGIDDTNAYLERETPGTEVYELVKLFGREKDNSIIIAHINNGIHPTYKQDTPKKRVLAALHDLKRIEDETIKIEPSITPVELPQPKQIIRYVAVDVEIRKETKELELVCN